MMTTKQLCRYLNNEDEAEQYLIKSGILRHFDKCPTCGSSHLGRVRRGKYKCYGCNTEWNLRKGSFIERKKITLGEFIGILKFFSDGMNTNRCAKETELGIQTVATLYNNLRKSLFGYPPLEIKDVHYVKFFIKEFQNQVIIELGDNSNRNDYVPEITASRSKDLGCTYSFNFSYNAKRSKQFLNNIKKIDKLDNFYRFCQERLLNYRGRDVNSLFYTLQELAFRYNHKNEDFFNILINKITL